MQLGYLKLDPGLVPHPLLFQNLRDHDIVLVGREVYGSIKKYHLLGKEKRQFRTLTLFDYCTCISGELEST